MRTIRSRASTATAVAQTVGLRGTGGSSACQQTAASDPGSSSSSLWFSNSCSIRRASPGVIWKSVLWSSCASPRATSKLLAWRLKPLSVEWKGRPGGSTPCSETASLSRAQARVSRASGVHPVTDRKSVV
jgi:hypothetical protein